MPGGATLGGSPLAFGEKANPDKAKTIERLQAEILALREQLASRSAAEGDQVAADINQAVKAESSGFVPVAATNCYGVKPCLHSTASDRIAAGCLEAIWEGHYGSDPARYEQEWNMEHMPGNKTVNRTFLRPLAPRPSETFRPSIGDQCDLTDAWSVLANAHVTDATEAHWNQRLRGVKHSVWLSVGSSIDHDAMKETCGMFAAPRLAIEAPPSIAYPLVDERPTLLVDWCYIARLNLTFAFVAANGLSTTWLQRNASLQQDRFREIGKQLQETRPPWRGGPIFLLFGGMEWDFKVCVRVRVCAHSPWLAANAPLTVDVLTRVCHMRACTELAVCLSQIARRVAAASQRVAHADSPRATRLAEPSRRLLADHVHADVRLVWLPVLHKREPLPSLQPSAPPGGKPRRVRRLLPQLGQPIDRALVRRRPGRHLHADARPRHAAYDAVQQHGGLMLLALGLVTGRPPSDTARAAPVHEPRDEPRRGPRRVLCGAASCAEPSAAAAE